MAEFTAGTWQGAFRAQTIRETSEWGGKLQPALWPKGRGENKIWNQTEAEGGGDRGGQEGAGDEKEEGGGGGGAEAEKRSRA